MTRRSAIAYLWRTQKWALMLMAAGLVAVVVFAVGALDDARRFGDPDRRQQPIEPWMTAQFVGRSYHIPPHLAKDLFEVDGRDAKRMTMDQIAANKGMSFDDLAAMVIQVAKDEEDRKHGDKPKRPKDPQGDQHKKRDDND